MSVIYTNSYRVDSRDVDPFGCCRPSALLGILQEAATDAAANIHASREEMLEKHNVFWMLSRIWYRLDRPLLWNERLTVRTCHRGGRGVAMYRDFDLLAGEKNVGEAVSLWVLADRDTRRLFRLSDAPEFSGTDGGEACKSMRLNAIRMPDELEQAELRSLRYSDADINGHVNNTRYADFACDALHLEKLGAGCFVSALRLGYLAECRPGEQVRMLTGEREGKWYVRGEDGGGRVRFDAQLSLSPWEKR